MPDTSPFADWSAIGRDAAFADAGACAARATRFERTIRWRNTLEFAAAALVIIFFGGGTVGAAVAGEWTIAAGMAMVVAGTLAVVWWLLRHALNLRRRPEVPCRDHYRAQLARQRDLLRAVPLRYLAPLLPGLLVVYAAVTARVAASHGWVTALEGVWLPLGATLAFFAFVAWLNLATARKLARKIAELDAA